MTVLARRPDQPAGFTLVEVIVALALAGLVSLILMHGIGLAARGLDRLSVHAERLDERRSLEMLMRRALGTAVAVQVEGDPGFVGHPTGLAFLSIVEDGGPGLYRIRLAFEPARPVPAVTLTRRLAGTSVAPRGGESVLVQPVRRLDIAYFGAASPAEEPGWHRDWVGMAALPQLVRIILDADDGPEQPPIVVRLRNAG